MMVGVMHPTIIGIEADGVGWMCPNHGKGAPGGREGSGDMAIVSSCVILAIASSGEVMRRPVISSRRTEISVGKEGVSVVFSALRNIDFSATLGFFKNMRRRALP